ncbi:MAG: NAD-dependent epimerase/dehydratase family protein [Ilumatobacteraceae bacterium]
MKIAITGASGLIGTAVSSHLAAAGHETVSLVRREPKADEIGWDPAAGAGPTTTSASSWTAGSTGPR